MRVLSDQESVEAMAFIDEAARIAISSSCLRWRCGSVIVKNKKILGQGYNSPPGDCKPNICIKDNLSPQFKSDKTCCVHAEERAIIDALRKNPNNIIGSRIYFIRIDDQGKKQFAGAPFCTICSKLSLEVGIGEFVLLHEQGICVYSTEEYNSISFQWTPEKK